MIRLAFGNVVANRIPAWRTSFHKRDESVDNNACLGVWLRHFYTVPLACRVRAMQGAGIQSGDKGVDADQVQGIQIDGDSRATIARQR